MKPQETLLKVLLEQSGYLRRNWPLPDVIDRMKHVNNHISFILAQEKNRTNFVAHLEQMYRTLACAFGACAGLSVCQHVILIFDFIFLYFL